MNDGRKRGSQLQQDGRNGYRATPIKHLSKLQVDQTNCALPDFLHSNEYKYHPLLPRGHTVRSSACIIVSEGTPRLTDKVPIILPTASPTIILSPPHPSPPLLPLVTPRVSRSSIARSRAPLDKTFRGSANFIYRILGVLV